MSNLYRTNGFPILELAHQTNCIDMKNITILALFAVLLMVNQTVMACDACGCSNSGSYFGLMPQSHKSLVGVRYQSLNFVTHPDSHVLRTEENFHITELYGRFFPIKRIQVMAFVPYRFAKQVTTSETKKQNGIGDATILTNYNVFNTFMDTEKVRSFNHTLLVGGGIKLPTGKFQYDESNPADVANPNFQSGTGSTDFILNVFYTLNKDQWGLSTNFSRKFNTENAENYKFGDQVYGTVDIYRSFQAGKLTITPSVGVYGENGEKGQQNGKEVLETGGYLVNATAGLTLFTERWTLGINVQTPVAQNLSAGFVQARNRGLIQLGFLF